MDVNKKFKKQKENVDFINECITKLIKEQSTPPPVDTGVSREMADAVIDLIDFKYDLLNSPKLSKTKSKDYGGRIMLRHGEIKFDDDDDTIISEKKSAGYKVYDVRDLGDKTILTLKGGDDNKLIPKNLILYITIPHKDGLNYRDDFEAELEQENIKTGDKDDLDDVVMRIISFN